MVAVIPIWQVGHGHPTSGLLSVGGTISHLLDSQVPTQLHTETGYKMDDPGKHYLK